MIDHHASFVSVGTENNDSCVTFDYLRILGVTDGQI